MAGQLKSSVNRIRIRPDNPIAEDIYLEEISVTDLEGKNIILVDDVANTGRTLFYAFQPLLKIIPGRLEVAVMVDRKHKLFPVSVDYVGISLATTLMENIPSFLINGTIFRLNTMWSRNMKKDAKAIFNHTPEMLTFFSDKLGVKYPWPSFFSSHC